jgi:transposase
MTLIIHSREEPERLLVTMNGEGWGIRKLARHFSISRNTVRRILRKHAAARDQDPDILRQQRKQPTPRHSKLDPFIGQIKKLLKDVPKITGQRVYEEICAAGYDGGISILQDRLRSLRPKPKKTPVIRFETAPGLQGQMDWSPYTIVNCFSYILGFSRRQYIDRYTGEMRIISFIYKKAVIKKILTQLNILVRVCQLKRVGEFRKEMGWSISSACQICYKKN